MLNMKATVTTSHPPGFLEKWLTFWGLGGGIGFPSRWRSCCSVIIPCVGPTGFWQQSSWCVIVAVAKKCTRDWQSQEPHDYTEMWQHRNYFLKPTASLWQASNIRYSFSPLLGIRGRCWKGWIKQHSKIQICGPADSLPDERTKQKELEANIRI